VTGAATFSYSGYVYDQETGTGTTLLQGATTDSAYYVALDGGRVLENAGTFTVNAASGYGVFYLGYNQYGSVGGGTIQNDSGATFDFQSASTVYAGSSAASGAPYTGTLGFTNAGTLEQTVTTGLTDIQVALTNTGTVSVQTGTLKFDGGGTSSAAGSFAVSSGATLDFNSGAYTISGGTFTNAGEVQVSGGAVTLAAAETFGGLLEIDSGTLALGANAVTAASLTQTGGTIDARAS